MKDNQFGRLATSGSKSSCHDFSLILRQKINIFKGAMPQKSMSLLIKRSAAFAINQARPSAYNSSGALQEEPVDQKQCAFPQQKILENNRMI
jgi:hypothetical protein